MASKAPPKAPDSLPRRRSAQEREAALRDMAPRYQGLLGGSECGGVLAPMENLRESHHFKDSDTSAHTPDAMRGIMKEVTRELPRCLEADPRGGFLVRYDEDEPAFLRAVVLGMEDTPYASGAFVFDIFLGPNYPQEPMSVVHVTPGAETLSGPHTPGGFSPNMHASSGKVCLSLLGTWSGPGWTAGRDNVYTLLSTILLQVVGVALPYFNEPSHGFWEGEPLPTTLNEEQRDYHETIMSGTARLAILQPLTHPPAGFEAALRAHFIAKRHMIRDALRAWADAGTAGLRQELVQVMHDVEVATLRAMLDAGEGEGLAAEVERLREEVAYVRSRIAHMQALVAAAGDDAAKRVPRAVQRLEAAPAVLERAEARLDTARRALADCVTAGAGVSASG